MAKKASKSQAIREYMAANPSDAPGDVAKALKVNPTLVYNVISNERKKSSKNSNGKKKTRAKRRSTERTQTSQSSNGQPLILAAELIKLAGSVEAAKEAVTTIEELSGVLS